MAWFTLFATTLAAASPLLPASRLSAAAPAEADAAFTPTQGTRESYGGSVYCLGPAAPPTGPTLDAAGGVTAPPRLGSAEMRVDSGTTISGRFFFFDAKSGAVGMTATCSGSVDPVSGRGLLKVRWNPPPGTPVNANIVPPDFKVSVLLKRGVLTGGTMDADGGVLAFRLERFLIVLP